MKQTLLEMVQRILESVDGQMIESISDTREAVQVANCVRETYYHLLYTRDIKARNNVVQMHSLSNTSRPTEFYINDDVAQITMFKYYDKENERYVDLEWVDPEEFINRSLNLNPKEVDKDGKPTVLTVKDPSGINYNVKMYKCPQYFTSFDDKRFICDSFNKNDTETLIEQYTVVYGVVLPEFKIEDTFVPDLAPQHFSLLLSKSKVQAAYELNKVFDELENDRARKQIVTADAHAKRVKGLETTLWKNRPRNGRVL